MKSPKKRDNFFTNKMKILIPAAYVYFYIQALNMDDKQVDNMLDYYEFINNYPFTGVYDAWTKA